MFQILSFDIGIKNFCYCIERYNLTDSENSVTKNAIEYGETVKILNTNISGSRDASSRNNELQFLTKTVFNNISTLLQSLAEYLEKTNVILIEKQVPKNIVCIKIAQHVWTWLNIKYPNIDVVNYHAMFKTSVFGQKHKTYYKRKKWAVNFTKEIMNKRQDDVTLLKLMHKKSDDMADCILMCLSYVIKTFG